MTSDRRTLQDCAWKGCLSRGTDGVYRNHRVLKGHLVVKFRFGANESPSAVDFFLLVKALMLKLLNSIVCPFFVSVASGAANGILKPPHHTGTWPCLVWGEAPESTQPPDPRPALYVARGGALAGLYALKQRHLRDLLKAVFFS